MASISPEAADRLTALHARVGVTYVAATVLGRSTVAAAGKLNIMAAGPAETVDALEPYFAEHRHPHLASGRAAPAWPTSSRPP